MTGVTPAGSSNMLFVIALFAVPLELGFSAGPAVADANGAVTAPLLRARLGVDLGEHFSLDASLVGAAGSEQSRSYCGSPCRGNASLRAIGGYLSFRFFNPGDVQGFGEVGVGAGHLINLSNDDLFENPAQRGRGGLSALLGGGVRWWVLRNLAVGAGLQWTIWSNISQPAFTYGNENIPASSQLTASALALLLSVDFATGR